MTHTLQSITKDFKKYCKQHNHTTHAPPCDEFFNTMQYSRWQLQKRNISWKEFITELGYKLALPRYAGKEVSPYRRKGLAKAKNVLKTECQCGSMFLTEVDFKGSKLNRRCDACKAKSINKEDYSGLMGESLFNVVPEEGDVPRGFGVEVEGRLY
jgi:hypothetical protein